jgi:hypothetical protein
MFDAGTWGGYAAQLVTINELEHGTGARFWCISILSLKFTQLYRLVIGEIFSLKVTTRRSTGWLNSPLRWCWNFCLDLGSPSDNAFVWFTECANWNSLCNSMEILLGRCIQNSLPSCHLWICLSDWSDCLREGWVSKRHKEVCKCQYLTRQRIFELASLLVLLTMLYTH